MGSGYRDEREAAHARADALEQENRDLRSQLANVARAKSSGWRIVRWLVLAAACLVVTGAGSIVVLARGQLAPPDIDSPPGVTGAVRLEISPMPAVVSIDEGPPYQLDHFLSVNGLDPNIVHRVRVSAPGFQPEERSVVVPANGTRSLEIELRPISTH